MHGVFVFYRSEKNLENSGNLKSCQNHREISGRKFEFMWVKLENSYKRYKRYIPADFSLLGCSGENF